MHVYIAKQIVQFRRFQILEKMFTNKTIVFAVTCSILICIRVLSLIRNNS